MKPRPLIDLVLERLAALEAERAADHELIVALVQENRALRSYDGRSRSMVMVALTEIAAVQDFIGMEPPVRKEPAAGRLPLKMVAMDSGWSESGLRKRAQRDPSFGEQIGSKWFVDPTMVTPKR